jgi:hypothetical protein
MIPTRYNNFSDLFWNKSLRVSDNSFAYHQEFFTVHTAMVYVIQVCGQNFEQDQDGTGLNQNFEKDQDETGLKKFQPDPARKMSTNKNDIYHCCVYSEKLLMREKVTV